MGHGKGLTNEELAVIKAYKDTGLSDREIAKKIKRSPKVGRGKGLTNEELAVIKAYKDTGTSDREIAKKIKRSPKVVNSFKIGVNYGAYKGSGGKCKIYNRTKRVIVRRAAAQDMTASQIHADLQLPVSVQRVRQILHEDPNTVWKKRKPKPKLIACHKEVRLQFNLSKRTHVLARGVASSSL